MAEIELSDDKLVVHIQGADRFFALKSSLEVPLTHIASVEVDPPDAHGAWHGLRMGGTNLPGVITAGRFLHDGEWAFWDVHDPKQSIVIRLHDEAYAKVVVGVDDPQATANSIEQALTGKPASLG